MKIISSQLPRCSKIHNSQRFCNRPNLSQVSGGRLRCFHWRFLKAQHMFVTLHVIYSLFITYAAYTLYTFNGHDKMRFAPRKLLCYTLCTSYILHTLHTHYKHYVRVVDIRHTLYKLVHCIHIIQGVSRNSRQTFPANTTLRKTHCGGACLMSYIVLLIILS